MPKTADRETLCRELLTLCRSNADDLARIDEIKSALKAGVTENFQIRVAGLGIVKVSAPRPKACTGTAPEIVVEAFLKLPERERKDLLKRGLVVEAEQWKGAYYGSVTPELF